MSSGTLRRSPLGLNVHPPGLAEPIEVVDVEAAEVNLKRLEHRGDRHVEVAGLAAIELEPELGNADRERREEAGELGASPGLGHETVGNVGQRLHAPSLAILDQELEAARRAQPLDRRGREDERQGVLNLGGKRLLEPRDQSPGPQFRRLALAPRA